MSLEGCILRILPVKKILACANRLHDETCRRILLKKNTKNAEKEFSRRELRENFRSLKCKRVSRIEIIDPIAIQSGGNTAH